MRKSDLPIDHGLALSGKRSRFSPTAIRVGGNVPVWWQLKRIQSTALT